MPTECQTQLTSAFTKQYPEVPSFIVDYLNECLITESYPEWNNIYDLIFEQIEVYYETVKEVSVQDFSKSLIKILTKFKDENDLDFVHTKLSSTVGLNSSIAKKGECFNDDVLLIDSMALPDRTKVDKKKLEKAREADAKKKAKAEEAERLALENENNGATEGGPILAGVSQANAKVSLETFSSLILQDFDMSFGNVKLLEDANKDGSLQFNRGQRYGLVGLNGSGKSTFLRLIGSREFQFHPDFQVAHVEQELESSSTAALESVLLADKERHELLEKIRKNPDSPDLAQIYEKLEEIDADSAPTRAAQVLVGLGFTHEEQSKPVSSFSGGWRMRLALAQALFSRPDILLLDEPTNMLDLKAIMWLENYLINELEDKCITIVVSHDRNFLRGVFLGEAKLKLKIHYLLLQFPPPLLLLQTFPSPSSTDPYTPH